jgi:alpha-beta hydrolase superfamily lysophospholipase
MRPRPVEFRASDGLTLRGQQRGDGERWAVLVHDEGGDLDAWKALVGMLSKAGLCVLSFDLRGHGASDDPWEPARSPDDVLAALDYADSGGARTLYLIGAGAGATAALAAAGSREVRALVALSPRADLPGLAPDAIRKTSAPRLILVGKGDPRAAGEADDVFRRSIGWAVVAAVPVEVQGTCLLASSWGTHVREHIAAFLRDYP